MANVVPSGWRELRASGALQRELETLGVLADALPERYTVYHGVHWTRVQGGISAFGEVDFVVVGPSGRALLIEQKSGFLQETPEGLKKTYERETKSVRTQIERSLGAIQTKYSRAHAGERLQVDYLLFCPDYQVRNPAIAGIDAARIVDAGRREHLARIIQSVISAGEPPLPQAAHIHRFLSNALELVPEIGAVAGEARALYTRISGGLATWGRRIDAEPFRLRVVGTAGSGKTQLALAVLRDASLAGRRAAYICFNRPLADHLRQLAPPGCEVANYHQLCDRMLRARGEAPDFTRAGAFAQLEAAFAALAPGEAETFDEVIIDEGQDIDPAWVEPLFRLARPGARLWWLEDPMQNLYGREPVALPGWTVLRSDTNYRSPRDILKDLNALVRLERPIEAGSPLSGSGVEILTYAGTAQLVEETKRGIGKAVAAGFRRSMIAVVTFRGRERSALSSYTALGPYRLRTFTHAYDLLGAPIYAEGDVTLESVYRFKGQSAPAVVFTEIDLEAMDELAVRKLFVGATRATMKLVLVVSERSARLLLERLASS
jgi:hypothetical protein